MPGVPHGTRLPIGRSLYSRSALIDTGAFLAVTNLQDQNHHEALECLVVLARHRIPLFVSLPTIYESHRRFLFDLGYPTAIAFLQEVFDGSVNIVRTVDQDETEARTLLGRYAALGLTLTDAANMAVMTRLGIAAAFSFDADYLAAGFIRIPPFHL
jgi:predicted nucleic acid-binding protein